MIINIENICRLSHVKCISVITAVCILMSITITPLIFFAFSKEIQGIVFLNAIIVPLIIAPVVSSSLVKLVIEKELEKKRIYKDSANEAKKILKDFLHDVQYFDSEAERIGGFDGNTMQNLETALKNTQDKLEILNSTGDLTADNEITHE